MCTSVHLDAKPCFYVHMYTRFVPIWIYVYIKRSEFYLFFKRASTLLANGETQHVIHGLSEVRCPRFWWLIKINIRILSWKKHGKTWKVVEHHGKEWKIMEHHGHS